MIKNFTKAAIGIFYSLISDFPNENSNNSNNAAVISLHRLGDTVFTIPAIQFLKEKYKDNLTVFCFPESRRIYNLYFKDLNIVILEKDWFYKNRIANVKARKLLQLCSPKVIFDITGTIASATLIAGIRAEKIFGLRNKYFENFYTSFIPARKTPRLTNTYFDVVQLAFNDEMPQSDFPVNENNNSELILINSFAGWKAKEWGFEKYVELIQRMKPNYDCRFIFEKSNATEELREFLISKNINWIETETIEELIFYFRKCYMFIGNDSGPAYIARLMGKPTFQIFGPTNANYVLPFDSHHVYLQKTVLCSPKETEQLCFTNGGRSGCKSFECMKQLSVDEVYNSLLNFLKVLKAKQIALILDK